MKKTLLIIYLLCAQSTLLFAQNLDSLWQLWTTPATPDSVKYEAIKVLAQQILYNNPDSAYQLATYHWQLASDNNDQREMADALSTQGIALDFMSRFQESIALHEQAMLLYEETGYKKGQSNSLNNIGMIYSNQGLFSKAVTYHLQSLKLREEINYTRGIASSLGNIGNVYKDMHQYAKGIEYLMRSLKMFEEQNIVFGQIIAMENIGLCYVYDHKPDEAEPYFQKCLKLSTEYDDLQGICNAYINMSLVCRERNQYKEGIVYNRKAIEINRKVNNPQSISICLANISHLYYMLKDYKKSIAAGDSALAIGRSIQGNEEIRNAAQSLYDAHKALGHHSTALAMHELYITMRDSVENDRTRQEIMRQELEYQYEKKALADSIANASEKQIKDAEIAKQQAEITAQRQQKYALFGGIALVLIFSFVMYNRYKITQVQKRIIEETNEELNQTNEELATQRDHIEHQKQLVEQAHQDIKDSILYAKRIQEAILPSLTDIEQALPQSFVVYQPKDVVAGDFYWMEQAARKVYIAAADCTGHGVPGAMVSVVCSNALTKAVLEDGITDVGNILDRTREIVIDKLAKSSDVKDGMDISLACIDLKNNTLEWAGANNPLYLLRHSVSLSIDITKGDKEPIGFTDHRSSFTKHTFDLHEGDMIYLFTDGYADQFGGNEGKKLGYKLFRDKLQEISSQPMDVQQTELTHFFDQWKNDEEQVDDVCIIGIKI